MKPFLAKMTAVLSVLFLFLNTGCHYFYDQVGEEKRIPSPLADSFPCEVEGELYRVWRGNELQLKTAQHTTYVLLQGVNNPDMAEDIEQQSIDFLHSLITEKIVRAVIIGTDERKRAIAQVYSGDRNINLEMIASGWGQYDEVRFDRADEFAAAERKARELRLGIWQ